MNLSTLIKVASHSPQPSRVRVHPETAELLLAEARRSAYGVDASPLGDNRAFTFMGMPVHADRTVSRGEFGLGVTIPSDRDELRRLAQKLLDDDDMCAIGDGPDGSPLARLVLQVLDKEQAAANAKAEHRATQARLLDGLPSDVRAMLEAVAVEAKLPEHIALTIEHNPHRVMRTSAVDWLASNDDRDFADVTAEDRHEMLCADEIWVVHWYPFAPNGSRTVAAATLERALALALAAQ